MWEVCKKFNGNSPATAAEWAERLQEGPLEDCFRDVRGNLKSARACATIVGNLFRAYLDDHFEIEGRRFSLFADNPRGTSHPPIYGFREVTPCPVVGIVRARPGAPALHPCRRAAEP
jgi:hypothetical protein